MLHILYFTRTYAKERRWCALHFLTCKYQSLRFVRFTSNAKWTLHPRGFLSSLEYKMSFFAPRIVLNVCFESKSWRQFVTWIMGRTWIRRAEMLQWFGNWDFDLEDPGSRPNWPQSTLGYSWPVTVSSISHGCSKDKRRGDNLYIPTGAPWNEGNIKHCYAKVIWHPGLGLQ